MHVVFSIGYNSGCRIAARRPPQSPPNALVQHFRTHRSSGRDSSIGSPETGQPRGTTSAAYEKLRELIVAGRLAPGTRLIETTVAERLGVSRTPVRGALQRLEQEGYVVADRGGKRTQMNVAPLTQEDGRELFWIVGELEGVAAFWVTQLPAAQRRTLVNELRRINQELLTAASETPADAGRIFDLHTIFHERYIERCGGPRLLAMHQTAKPQVERYRRLYSTARGADLHESVAEHEVIIRRIEEGDCQGAERAVQSNWRNAAERLAAVIEQVGERGSW
jgi:DNA-binding GntR family transcriptional regulator